MNRIPYPDWDKLSQEKREAMGYPEHYTLNVTRMQLHLNDKLWRANYALKQGVIHATTIDEKLREVLIMRVAFCSNCKYEIYHHMSISKNLGFTPEKQEAIRLQQYDKLSEQEAAVAKFTDEVVLNIRASDETMAKMRSLFPDTQIIEMIIVMQSYMGTARIAQNADIEVDEKPVQGWVKSHAKT
ncbi:MAG: carboxymuconolactone decarboxylase family protein [Alphaproteobacteria bacterium]